MARHGAWRLLKREVIRASEAHAPVDFATLLNALLDAIPRVEIRWSGRPRPAFRTCGTVGFGVAVLVAVSAAMLGNRSMLALAEATGVAVLSFFGWAYLRRAITGVERLVLLEHVWLALLCVVVTLWLQGLPVSATLDPFCAGLAFFLAGGRAGCSMVGCCHGHPSGVGFRYPSGHAKQGFASYLTEIRLFPVQLLEFVGLVLIGVITFMLVALAQPGAATIWYLFSYALLRFALEELRADDRPHFFTMSVARWMCLGEFAFILALSQPPGWIPILLVSTGLALHLGRDTDRRLLASGHIQELRELLERFRKVQDPPPAPLAWSTSRRVTLAISRAPHEAGEALHISLCLPSRKENLELACRLAAEAYPQLDPSRAVYRGSNTLHFALPQTESSITPTSRLVFEKLYRKLLKKATTPETEDHPSRSAPLLIPWYWRGAGEK